MRCHLGLLFGLLFATVMTACGSGRYYATARPAKAAMTLDDVTNGLQSNASKSLVHERSVGGREDPAANPPGGAFFSDETIATRRENVFGEPLPVIHEDEEEPAPRPAERMLVYQGQIAVEVARPEEAIAAFLVRVAGWGGYMQSQVDSAVTVRVPAEHFEAAFESLRVAGRVLHEMRRAQDVTEEFLDLEIRLGNARKSRERLLAILEQAEKVEDVLKIEEQLQRLTDEIETMEGRRKYLSDQVALATLQAEFRAVAEAPPVQRRRRPSRFPWINLIGPERVMEDF